VTGLPTSPASERNKQPILDVLRDEFEDRTRVLEIGSGTAQHAVFFAAAMPHLIWQTSDLVENCGSILARLGRSNPGNVRPPLALDVETFEPEGLEADAVFSANTAHIMSLDAVRCMFALAGRLLPDGGVFCLYGPFNFEGRFSSDSNAAFDASLRRQDPSMGIRELADLDRFAERVSLSRIRLYAMPANNHLAVWRKSPAPAEPGEHGT
jgi:hypothetical protein